MSLIDLVTPDKATGVVADVYGQAGQTFGTVPLPLQMWAASPTLLQVFATGVGYYMGHQTLSQPMLAWIRYLVAERDRCSFCIDFNKGFLMEQLGVAPEAIDRAKEDPASTPLPEKEKALLSLVLKAVKDAHSVTAEEIEAVKAMGFSEQAVFEAVAAAALVVIDDLLLNTFKVQ